MNISPQEQELCQYLSDALRKNISEVSEEELLDIMERKWSQAVSQRRYGNIEEARSSMHIAMDIKTLLKLRIKRLREGNSR